ncbi:retrotransposon protein, putative, ty1-copia subclass [Tanacetum coccineum]
MNCSPLQGVGHCKRNCFAYLAELIKKKKQVGTASSSDVFIIELFSFPTKSWVYDTSCVHRLVKNGFVQRFKDFGISVSKNNVHYFDAIPSNGIYEIDMHNLVPNVNSIFNVSTKRAKHIGDQLILWHCRLAHISKKRIEKLQHEGLLKSIDDESFDQCVSCLSGNMTRKSFSHRHERATDLLGIIHTDDYALESAIRILNMVPTKKVDKTPYELWYGKVSNLSYLKVWGCEALVKRDTPDKLQQRSVKYEDTSPSENTSEIPIEVEGFEPPQEEEILIRRSERTRRAPNRLCLNVEAEEHSLGDLNECTSYKAAMLDFESNKWIDAMNAAIQSMMDNMKKTDMDGIVHTYKALLVAKGYTQLYEVDYEETFSPVTDIKAIRILISIATYYDYEIWQMDIKTAFLNGYLDEDIYMVQPEASRSWNKRFDEEIKRFGFAQNLEEPCVYQKTSGSNVTFLILYVDDIIIMGNHIPSLQSVKDYLGKCFAMKDLGEAAFILGIKIYRDKSKRLIRLCQNAYMDKILKRYRMDNSKRGHIPMQERLDMNKTQGVSTPEEVKRMQNIPYASTVGSIINTKDMFLVYGGNLEAELRVDCYYNVGFETDIDDMKSLIGYVHKLNYIAASEAEMEAVWIRKFISGLGIVPTINEPIGMFYDNLVALHFANEPRVQKGTRHYHRRYHYVRECIALGKIRFLKVHTYDNLADPFTKALPKGKLTQHARSMGLRLASSFM